MKQTTETASCAVCGQARLNDFGCGQTLTIGSQSQIGRLEIEIIGGLASCSCNISHFNCSVDSNQFLYGIRQLRTVKIWLHENDYVAELFTQRNCRLKCRNRLRIQMLTKNGLLPDANAQLTGSGFGTVNKEIRLLRCGIKRTRF